MAKLRDEQRAATPERTYYAISGVARRHKRPPRKRKPKKVNHRQFDGMFDGFRSRRLENDEQA
jgi:hypothetical protein